jgi:hypothetical protein
MYWRVRGSRGGADTSWSYASFSEASAIDEVRRDAALASIPEVPYNKSAGSNTHGLHWSIGQSTDKHHVNNVLVNNDNYTEFVRDVSVRAKFEPYIGVRRPEAMKMIDFREIVRTFIAQARNSPSVESIKKMVEAMLCETPAIEYVRLIIGTFVNDPSPFVDVWYLPDTNSYQTITFNSSLITGNIYDLSVDAFALSSIPFNTNSNTTLQDIASAIAARPGVAWAKVVDAGAGTNDDRIIVIKASVPSSPPVLSGSVVTGGASQALTTVATTEAMVAETLWNNGNLSNGVIVNVTDPLGAEVTNAFASEILRKLAPADAELYVLGI